MGTTQLFVELLVIGFGAVLWLWLLAGAFLGVWLGDVALDSRALAVGAVTAVAYTMGIVVDRVGRLLYSLPERHYEASLLLRERLPAQGDTQRYVLLHAPSLARSIEYNRSRLRVCRAWSLNLLVGTIELAVLRVEHGSARPPGSAFIRVLGGPHLGLIATGALLTVVTGSVAVWLIRDHYRNLAESYLFLRALNAAERVGAAGTTEP